MDSQRLLRKLDLLQELFEDFDNEPELRAIAVKYFDKTEAELKNLYPVEYREYLIDLYAKMHVEDGKTYAAGRKIVEEEMAALKKEQEDKKEFFRKRNICYICFKSLDYTHEHPEIF